LKPLLRIITYTRSLWRLYGIIAGFTVTLALLNQAQPLLVKGIVDRLVGAVEGTPIVGSEIAQIVILIFLADASVTIISNISGYYGDIMALRLRRQLTLDYFDHLMKLPQSYFDNEKTGAIINRLDRSLGELRQFMNILANNFLQFILTTVFTLVIIAYYSWEIAILLAILYPVFLWMTQRTSRHWQVYQTKINDLSDRARARFTESITQVKVVKAFVRENSEASNLSRKFSGMMRHTRLQSKEWHRRDIERRLVLNVIFLMVYAIIGAKGFNGDLTVGEIVLLVQYAGLIRLPLFSMSFLVDNTQRAVSGSQEFFDVIQIEPEISDAAGSKELVVKEGEISFDGVSFGYKPGDVPVIQGIDFVIKPGQKLALVGESGQGKTTISNLLLRLYDPTNGLITIDGQDVAQVTQASLRKHIGVVFQEPALFSGTIRENISYGQPKASERAIIEAAKAANADSFIKQFKDGYNTEIGERGIKLSGGQKQRIAIARAILHNPPILILDEATSSLDSKAEAQVQAALDRLVEGRTTLIIAHRLSTIKDVDTIVTLRGGNIDEIGSPSQLAQTDGIYAQLLKLQQASKSERDTLLKRYDIVS
jgi:ATP-binding cassette subfamily B protein